MSGSTFTAVTPKPSAADPFKHVNYTLGMVLGVDDFTQEFAYLDGHDHWMARDAIGYGTVTGLAVSLKTDAPSEARVSPGAAITPRGQLVRVPSTQCAQLDAWLEDNTTDVTKWLIAGASGPPTVRLYVVLSYFPCPTDEVPIPGEPCRDESELLKPSRIADEWRLELRFRPPDQREELAVRDFVKWLKDHIRISDGPPVSIDDFIAALRKAALAATPPADPEFWPLTSPPEVPVDFMVDSSPPGPLNVPPEKLCDYLRAAIRIWITELRPRWRPDWLDQHIGKGDSINPTPDEGDSILLAELDVPLKAKSLLDGRWNVLDPKQIIVDESKRPLLAHVRFLQQMITCGPGGGAPLAPADTVASEKGWNQAANAGVSVEYSRGDHTHGTQPDPVPPHDTNTAAHANLKITGDVTGTPTTTTVVRIQGRAVSAAAPANGNLLTFNAGSWVPQAPAAPSVTLSGDVTGPSTTTSLSSIQGKPVAAPAPAAGNVLTFNGASWIPQAPAAPAVTLAGEVVGPSGGTQVARLITVPIKQTVPTVMGQQISFDANANQWVPAYGVVTAGVIDVLKKVVNPPVYNALALFGTGVSLVGQNTNVEFTFKNYVVPSATNLLIVKGTLIYQGQLQTVLPVQIASFNAGSITMRIAGANVDVIAAAALMQLQIEVTRYFF